MRPHSFAARFTLIVLAACAESATTSSVSPTSSPPPPQSATNVYALSGLVTEKTAQGVRQSSGALVNAWIQGTTHGYSYWYMNGRREADAVGHYELSGLPTGTTAQLQVWKEGFVQQCAAPLLTVEKNLNLDAQLVARASLSSSLSSVPDPAAGFRHVTGVVYIPTDSGNRPVADAFVDYEPIMDFPAAVTFSDAEGKFLLCALPNEKEVTIGVGFQGRVAYVTVPPGQRTGVEVVLPR